MEQATSPGLMDLEALANSSLSSSLLVAGAYRPCRKMMASISTEKPMARDTTTAAPTPGESTCAGEAAMLGGQRIKGAGFSRGVGGLFHATRSLTPSSSHYISSIIALCHGHPNSSLSWIRTRNQKTTFIDRGHLQFCISRTRAAAINPAFGCTRGATLVQCLQSNHATPRPYLRSRGLRG